MEELFSGIVSMSLTASYVIVFIILIRLLLRKAPRVISYALWSVAAFRLLLPFTFHSLYSLIPRERISLPANSVWPQKIPVGELVTSLTTAGSNVTARTVTDSADPLQVITFLGSIIWLVGVALMLSYSILSILVLKRRLRGAVYAGENVYEVQKLGTPFVLGIIRPGIYIPAGLGEEERSFVIRHEQTHIRRFDHIIKLFAYFLLCIHWFNPFVWIAFMLMSSDMELSCDEKVIREMGKDIRKAYSASLLSLALGKRILNGSPLAFGEGNVKRRINNVLNYKKPHFWIIVAAVVVAAVAGIGLLANPISPGSGEGNLGSKTNNQKTLKDIEESVQKANPLDDKSNIKDTENSKDTSVDISTSYTQNTLEKAIHNAVLKENSNQYPESDIITEAHTVLKIVEKNDTTTVYAMVLYMRFNRKEHSLEESGGSHIPVAMTFTKRTGEDYDLKEYWIPQDGSRYAPSIRKKFPNDIAEDAIDTQKYVMAEIQSCYAQAVNSAKISMDDHLKELIDIITSEPMTASNPRNYIDKHPIEYRELLYYSIYTLRYCFGLFEEGEQTGLKGQIMASACKDILGKEAAKIKGDNGQSWYDSLKKNALKQLDKHGEDYMKENMPGAVILLQRLGEIS